MTINQISVFVENKEGSLEDFAEVLFKNNINMRALSLAETKDFGVVRIIVNDSYKTACVLKDAGYIFSVTPVIAAAVPDEPGGMFKLLKVLGQNGINLEYTYAITAKRKDYSYIILRVENSEKTADILIKKSTKKSSVAVAYGTICEGTNTL